MWVKDGFRFSVILFTFSSASSCFIYSPIDHNSPRILTYDGSKDVVWCEDKPLRFPKC